MKTVSQFESNLILILRCLLCRAPLDRTLPLILRKVGRPRCLSRAAVELVQDSLSKGLPVSLARGGWRKERFLRNERIVSGRVWERSSTEERALHFSAATLEWLIWLTAVNPAEEDELPAIDRNAITSGDHIFFFFAFNRLEESRLAGPLLKQPWFAEHALLWLTFPERFAEHGVRGGSSFHPWLEPHAVWLPETLQDRLADRWVQIEQGKCEFSDWRKLQAVGAMQRNVLARFLSAIEEAGRRDLARFLLRAANAILDGAGQTPSWFPRLDLHELRLADRADVLRDGLAFLQELSRLQQWELSTRTVGYYDDGYAAGQLWKSDWERWNGTAVCTAATEIIRRTLPFQV